MKDVLLVFSGALRDSWDELALLVLMNVVTVLLMIPVVTSAPAVAALWFVGNQAARGRTIGIGKYFGAFRQYFWKAWGLTLIGGLGLAVLLANFWFYVSGAAPIEIGPAVTFAIGVFWMVLAFLWLTYQMYPLALLLEQEDQRIQVALRNAVVLLIANPGFSVLFAAVLLVIGLVLGLLLWPLWFLILLAFFAVASNKAVVHLLSQHRERAAAGSDEDDL